MKPTHVSQLLAMTIPAGYPVLLTGAPGVGKTSLVEQACVMAGADCILEFPALADPTDAKGLPWPDATNGSARFLPFGNLKRVLAADKPTVWFWDDLGQAPASVQASYMPALLARMCGDARLPDCVTIVAATNGREHRAGVNGLLAPVKSRFTTILPVEPDLDSWVQWSLTAGIAPEIIAFIRQRPDLLCAAEVAPGLLNEYNPRSIANASRLYQLGLPDSLILPAITGAVGEAWAIEFMAFLRLLSSMVSVEAVLTDPTGAPLPQGPSQSYALVTALAMRSTTGNFDRVAKYITRLVTGSMGEFGALCAKDALKRTPELAHTSAYSELMVGPCGKLIMGDAS